MIRCALAGVLSLIMAGNAAAQDASADAAYEARVQARVASMVQPSNAARGEAVMALIREAGFEPEVETFGGGGQHGSPPLEGRNISFVVHGVADPGTLDEILLTAHYDAVVLEDGTLADGVVDNAGSVVAVIQAAELLRARHLGRDVRVILFDQEELGLIGAHRWVEANGIDGVAAVVNADVGAFGSTMMYGQNNGPQSLVVTQAVQRVCAETALQCVGYPNYPPSDDRVFSAAGAPVVSLGFQDEVGAHQMWLAFNAPQGRSGLAAGFMPEVFTIIHSENDTLERLDPATVILAGQTYATIVSELNASLPVE